MGCAHHEPKSQGTEDSRYITLRWLALLWGLSQSELFKSASRSVLLSLVTTDWHDWSLLKRWWWWWLNLRYLFIKTTTTFLSSFTQTLQNIQVSCRIMGTELFAAHCGDYCGYGQLSDQCSVTESHFNNLHHWMANAMDVAWSTFMISWFSYQNQPELFWTIADFSPCWKC